MKKSPGQHIVILGCGNVAWHLAKHFQALKKYAVTVYNHQENVALNDFNVRLKCSTEVGFDHVNETADFYFVCVPDRFISETAAQLNIKNPNAILVHTSGSAKLDELGERVQDTGVFYPLQTFSKSDIVDWTKVPIIIESANRTTTEKLVTLAGQFSNTVEVLSYKERLKMHLSAVLVNNFTNALYVAASSLIAGNKLDGMTLLLPIIKQTTQKLETLSPLEAQTGPAMRGDEGVLKKHQQLLSKDPELKKIYKLISKLIAHQQKKSHD